MKALVKSRAEPGLWWEEVAVPQPGRDDVLIKVTHTSICGTDLHIFEWNHWAQQTIPVPLVIGHEFTGEIVELGDDVEGLAVGQRVAGEGHITCGHCRNCRAGRRNFCHNHQSLGVTCPGAFAEYVSIPAENVFTLPEHINPETASVLDPLGNATHSALYYDVVGEDVLITGAGPIGLMAAAIVRHIGARFVVVTDINPYRLQMASAMGADSVIDVTTDTIPPVMDILGMTEGFDIGLEMSGNGTAFNDMLSVMNNGGRIAALGIPPASVSLDLNTVIFKGLNIQGIYGRRIFDTWYKMAAMLQSGLDISPVITHKFPASSFADAFDVVASGTCGKVILDWV